MHPANASNLDQCQRAEVPLGERSQFHYDERNRVLFVDHPAGTADLGFSYEGDGAVASATVGELSAVTPPQWKSIDNRWSYSYNKRRLPQSESLAIDGKTFALQWDYHPRGDRQGMTYPSGLQIDFNPNAYGEPRSAGAFAHTASYHANGALAALTYGNSATRTQTLNARQLPLRIHDSRAGSDLLDHTLSYDPNGNIDSLTDGVLGGLESRAMSYDARDRLQSVTAASGNETYRYDPLDHVRQRVRGALDERFDVDANQRLAHKTDANGTILASYSWNARGELSGKTQMPVTSALFQNGFEATQPAHIEPYAYDRAGRLTGLMGMIAHRYDAHGRRVQTTTLPNSTRYQVYSAAGELLYSEDSTLNERSEYLHLGPILIAERTRPIGDNTATPSYLHTDHLGTPSVKTAADGQVVYRSRLAPYGAPYDGLWREGPGYTKHATDSLPKLVYMQQRYYDPDSMRFLSPDPVPASVSSFNVYAYANNNPMKYVDSDGQLATLVHANRRGVTLYQATQAGAMGTTGLVVATTSIIATADTISDLAGPYKAVLKNGIKQATKKIKSYYTRAQREKRFKEVDGKCEYCGKDTQMDKPFQKDSAEGDHMRSQAGGGKTEEANLANACRECNGSGGKSAKELGTEYTPAQPSDRVKKVMDENMNKLDPQ